MAYAHKNSKGKTYYLHTKKVDLKGSGKTQVIYWFAGAVGPNGLEEVPVGYTVIESKRTGLPLLKKK